MQRKSLKICNLILVVFLLCARLSAYSGMMTGESKLKISKTQWFDIIYPERCEESAAILYEKADTVYEEVTALYGLTPAFRIPVVITPTVEQFNAFWTAVPYNHIAIYDTGSSGGSDLAVFSETLLSTFRHELTHAVTFNMKNGFWRVLGKVFGDCVDPGMLSVTTGMAEGATLTSESASGEGRLNNEYTKHYVKQAKIEGKFPSYHDVSGSADVQPSGAPYYFNGAFHEWLQEKYGLQAYAQFWYRVVNGKNFTISGAFKKAFGIKLKKAWKQFEAEYEVPAVAANPVEAGEAKDFFEPESDDFSNSNNTGSYYTSLTSAGGRIAWIDNYGGKVYSAVEGEKPRHIFSQRGISDIKLSGDGRFLAVNYISKNGVGDKARVKIYDFQTKKFFTIKDTGLKEAAVIQKEKEYFVIAQKYFAQHYSIAVYKLEFYGYNRYINGAKLLFENKLETEINPFAFLPYEDGKVAWLKRNRLNYSLCISDITSADGKLLKEIAFPEGMSVHSLSYSNGLFYFSYVQEGTLPRLGTLNLEEGSITLGAKDISGGIFEPVYWNNQIVYIGEFYRQNRILCLEAEGGEGDADDETFEVAVVEPEDDAMDLDLETESETTPKNKIPSKTYIPFPYFLRGTLIPLSDYTTDVFNFEGKDSTSILDNFYPGLTYLTANPWATGSTDLIKLTAGFNIYTRTAGTALTISKGTATSLFGSETTIKSEFDKEGWKQGALVLDLSSVFEVGRISTITLSNSFTALVNRKSIFSLSDIVSAQYSTIRKSGPGRFEKQGFAFSVSYGKWYEAPFKTPKQELVKSDALAAGIRICVPHLLPFESAYGYTYNFPVTTIFKILPSSSTYSKKKGLGRVVFDGSVESTLFSMDIQKAIPFATALYLNDFYVAGGYAATGTAGNATEEGFQTAYLIEYFKAIADGRGHYLDSVYVKAQLDFVPNVGVFASPNFKMGIYAVYRYHIRGEKGMTPKERETVSLGLDMSF